MKTLSKRGAIKEKTPCGDNGFDPKLLYAYERYKISSGLK
jgi:hypothetical protein